MLSHTLLVIAAVFVAPATAFSAPATAAPGLSRPPAEFLRAVLAARTKPAAETARVEDPAAPSRGPVPNALPLRSQLDPASRLGGNGSRTAGLLASCVAARSRRSRRRTRRHHQPRQPSLPRP